MARLGFASTRLSEMSEEGQSILVFFVKSVAKNLMSLSSICSPPILIEFEDERTKVNPSHIENREREREVYNELGTMGLEIGGRLVVVAAAAPASSNN